MFIRKYVLSVRNKKYDFWKKEILPLFDDNRRIYLYIFGIKNNIISWMKNFLITISYIYE